RGAPARVGVCKGGGGSLVKGKIRGSLQRGDDLAMEFGYEGEVTAEDSEQILDRITAVHRRALDAAGAAETEERRHALEQFACSLEKAFYGFEADFFQQNLSRIVDDVIGDIRSALELWPTLVEICYFRKQSRELPQTRVANQKKK